MCAGRYLFRHNYTDLTVNAVYEAINKPPLREANLKLSGYREFDRAGSNENWVEYLSQGMPARPCPPPCVLPPLFYSLLHALTSCVHFDPQYDHPMLLSVQLYFPCPINMGIHSFHTSTPPAHSLCVCCCCFNVHVFLTSYIPSHLSLIISCPFFSTSLFDSRCLALELCPPHVEVHDFLACFLFLCSFSFFQST